MVMTDDQIIREYKQAKSPVKQIGILADLNSCTKREIAEVLLSHGVPVPKYYQPKAEPEQTAAAKPERMTRKSILAAAERCVWGEREQDYGSLVTNFQTTANLWTDYLQGRGVLLDMLEPYDVAAMLALLKLARIATGHGKTDNWIDLAGYAACGGELERDKYKENIHGGGVKRNDYVARLRPVRRLGRDVSGKVLASPAHGEHGAV